MLQSIRERAQGWIAWIIVGLIILTFALWGIGEYFREEPPIYVAKVNDEPITQMEFQRAMEQERARLQEMMRGADLTQFEQQLKQQVLERLIDRKLMVQAAREAGMVVSDAQLVTVIRGIEAFHDENGEFSNEIYTRRVNQLGFSTTAFEEQLRGDLLTEQLVNGITETAFATDRDVESVFVLQEQKRDLGYVVFPVSAVAEEISLTEEAIRRYYEEHPEAFQEPEKVKLAYLRLSLADIAKQVEVSEEEIESYYRDHQDLYGVPEQRRVAHILIAVSEGGDEEAARKKAEEVYAKLRAGGDFATLAKEYSDDPGSASQGGDLGYIEKGVLDPEFDDVAFSLAQGEVSEPVRTAFGYHIIRVEEIKPGHVKPLEEVRKEVERELRMEKAQKRYLDELERLSNLVFENPDALEPAAEALGLAIQESEWIDRRGGAGMFANPKVLEAAFSQEVLKDGYNSVPIEVSKTEAVVIRLKAHQPARVKPLEQVRAQVEEMLRREEAAALLQQRAERFMERVRAGEAPAAVAEALGGRWQRLDGVGRSGVPELPMEVLRTAFRLPRPAETPSMDSVTLAGGDRGVVLVFAVHDADPTALDEPTRARYRDALRQAFGGDEFNALLQALKAEAEIERYLDRL